MSLNISKIIGSQYAVDSSDGRLLFGVLTRSIDSSSGLVISFKEIEQVSTSFLNESIGKFVNEYSQLREKLNFLYPEGDFLIEAKVDNVIENALLGDEYDQMVDNTIMTL